MTPEYSSWKSVKQRCRNPKSKAYPRYGGRGITVCEEWAQSFQKFFEDMGPRPPGTSIERKNNDLGYFKGNCCWAGRTSQARNTSRNRKITFRGEEKCIADWASEYGVPCARVRSRLELGWSIEEALTVAPGGHTERSRLYTAQGKSMRLTDWSRNLGMNVTTISRRMALGMSFEEAIASPPSSRCKSKSLTYQGKTQSVADWSRELGITTHTLKYRLKSGWPLDRAMSDKTNEPRSNTRWVEYHGKKMAMADLARLAGMSRTNLAARIDSGLSPEQAADAPKQPRRKFEFRGETLPLSEWSKRLGIPLPTLYDRLQHGWSIEEALSTAPRGRRNVAR